MKFYEFQDENCRGRIERFEYVGAEGAEKYALVYLPYGYYDAPERRYDMLYMMHGGGGSPDAWLDSCPFKNMLDRSFAAGEAKPMIVVFPSFYKDKSNRTADGGIDHDFEHSSVLTFQRELTEQLIPAVEGRYRSFAEGTDPEALIKARDHRAFSGFSMGAVNTWYAFYLHADYFSVIIPLSGDCWALGLKGGSEKPKETALAIMEAVKAKGLGPDDFRIYAATGTEDIAYENLTPQIEAMKQLTDFFRFSEDYAEGNLHYLLGEGMIHEYPAVCRYVYEYLPYLFG